jgi:3-oxoacyl-[acyl-carrier protein] reductase
MLNNLLRRASSNSGDGGVRSEAGANVPRLDLRDHTALVTGSTGQLGRVIARTLADCGANVALHYFKQHDTAMQLKHEAESRGVRAYCIQADVTHPEAYNRMQAELAAAIGAPDIIVGNAVIQYQWTTIIDQPVEDYESQFRSNILQNVMLAKAFLPAMMQKRWGRFIAINSECAMQCHPTQSAYVAGKRGMDGLMRILAREVGEHQVTVNQVAPGWMISDAVRAAGAERQEFYEKQVPLRRRGQDQDVANAVAFLASDLASFITGAYLSVSGGNVMPTI